MSSFTGASRPPSVDQRNSGSSSSGNIAPASKPRVQQPRPQVPGPGGRVAGGTPSRPALPVPGGGSTSDTGGASASASSSRAPPAPASGPRIIGVVGSSSHILVNKCQKGNPLLQHFVHKGWEYADIVPDYQVGERSCVLYLSIKYHRLHPEYIHNRVEKLQRMFDLRILLVQCDVDNHQAAIQELTKMALVNKLTVMVAWRVEEAARYIELYKMFEHKPPDVIRERVADDYISQLNAVLTSVKGVNKTDVMTLATNFGSLQRIANATKDQLLQLPGFGETKAQRLFNAFNLPFRPGESRTFAERRQEERSRTGDSSARPVQLRGVVQANAEDPGSANRAGPARLPSAESPMSASRSGAADLPATTIDLNDSGSDAVNADEGSEDEFELSEAEQLRLAIEMSMAEDALAAAEAREAEAAQPRKGGGT